MPEQNLPPQSRSLALSAAGGGFGGALLAIVIAKILAGPCCCPTNGADMQQKASVTPVVAESRETVQSSSL